jgi:hypothetical protein
MSTLIVRSRVKAEHTADLEAAAQRLFAALEQAQPQGIRYASGRLGDGATYVAMLALDDGVENPLPAMPEFRAFQDGLRLWVAEPPVAEQVTVVGSYRMF